MGRRGVLLGAAGQRARAAATSGPVAVRSASGAGSTSTADVTVPKPSGLAVGDLMIGFHVGDNDTTLATMDGPSGWTAVGSEAGVASGHPYEEIWSRVATSADVAASGFTFVCGGRQCAAAILAITAGTYRTASPITGLAFQNGGTALATAHVAPSVTGVAGGLLVCSFGTDSGGTSASYSPPSGMTERADAASANGYTALEVATLALAAAGATGTKTATCTVSRPWKGAALIVNPAP